MIRSVSAPTTFRRMASVCACLLVLALCACSRAKLELSPRVIQGCALGHAQTVRVSWDARNTKTPTVGIFIRRPGSRERQWLRSKATGSRQTGRWVSDGMTFVLRDPAGKQLAIRTVETSRCALKQKDE
jgi:hypothetical protein